MAHSADAPNWIGVTKNEETSPFETACRAEASRELGNGTSRRNALVTAYLMACATPQHQHPHQQGGLIAQRNGNNEAVGNSRVLKISQ